MKIKSGKMKSGLSQLAQAFVGLAFCLSAGSANAVVIETYSFETCGAIGAFGPSQAACDAAYTATSLDGAVSVNGAFNPGPCRCPETM